MMNWILPFVVLLSYLAGYLSGTIYSSVKLSESAYWTAWNKGYETGWSDRENEDRDWRLRWQ